MDPCPFVRIVIGNLALKVSESTESGNFCQSKIKLKGFTTQISAVPVILQESDSIENRVHACFSFKKLDFDKLMEKCYVKGRDLSLKIELCAVKRGSSSTTCGWKTGKLLGSVIVKLDLKAVENSIASNKACMIQNGWFAVGGSGSGSGSGICGSQLNVNVRAEPDPRFVFQFDGEPECSPQVFQVNGNVKQPVFTCNFGFRNSGERNLRSRLVNLHIHFKPQLILYYYLAISDFEYRILEIWLKI